MEAEELARVPKFKARPLDKRVRVSSQWCYESVFYCRLAWFLAIASDQLFCVSRYSRAGVTSDYSGIINVKLHYPQSFTSRLANALKFAARLYHLRSLARYKYLRCSPHKIPDFFLSSISLSRIPVSYSSFHNENLSREIHNVLTYMFLLISSHWIGHQMLREPCNIRSQNHST